MLSKYRVELTAEYIFTIEETLDGPPGVSREDLEDLIDENWWWLSGSTDVLLESCWKLERFEELPAESN